MNPLLARRTVAALVAVLLVALIPATAQAKNVPGLQGKLRPGGFGWGGGNVDTIERLDRMGRFDILLAALETAGLTETVAEAELTLLAPTDDAFVNLLGDLGITAEDLLNSPDLADILLYHVLEGKQPIGRLLLDSTATTLSGEPILVTFERFRAKINDATVTRANVRTENGLIQILDTVLTPPGTTERIDDIVDVLRLDGRFSVLLLALETAQLDTALMGPDDLTLFAPTDAAFAALLEELQIDANTLLASPDLTDILLYHVVPGERRALSLLFERNVDTLLEGASIEVKLRAAGVRVNDTTVVNPNVDSPNGLIHVIDGVLLP